MSPKEMSKLLNEMNSNGNPKYQLKLLESWKRQIEERCYSLKKTSDDKVQG